MCRACVVYPSKKGGTDTTPKSTKCGTKSHQTLVEIVSRSLLFVCYCTCYCVYCCSFVGLLLCSFVQLCAFCKLFYMIVHYCICVHAIAAPLLSAAVRLNIQTNSILHNDLQYCTKLLQTCGIVQDHHHYTFIYNNVQGYARLYQNLKGRAEIKKNIKSLLCCFDMPEACAMHSGSQSYLC